VDLPESKHSTPPRYKLTGVTKLFSHTEVDLFRRTGEEIETVENTLKKRDGSNTRNQGEDAGKIPYSAGNERHEVSVSREVRGTRQRVTEFH